MKLVFLILLTFQLNALGETAHDEHHDHDHAEEHEHEHDHEHGSAKAVGEGKAILKVDEKLGFMLAPEAMAFMQIKFKNALSKSLQVPLSALVIGRNEKGIYRLREGFLKFIPVEHIEQKDDVFHLTTPDWKFGDRIVVNNVDLVRVSDIYSTDDAEYGHSH